MRHPLLIPAAVLALACAQAPTGTSDPVTPSFITYGAPDAGEHPYVGFMLFFDPTEPGWFTCTGTLLSETVMSGDPKVIERFKVMGLLIPEESPDQFAAGLKAEAELYSDVVKKGNVQLR